MKDRTIGIGCDHGGFELKEELKRRLLADGYEVTDKGIETLHEVDYPDIAVAVATGVTAGEYDCGILICGTGIGVSIAANKVPGIRAALCSDCFSARMAGEHSWCENHRGGAGLGNCEKLPWRLLPGRKTPGSGR